MSLNGPITIKEKSGRDGIDPSIEFCDFLVPNQYLVCNSIISHEWLDHLTALIIERDAKELDTLLTVMLLGGDKVGDLGAAGRAPGSPEVDHHNLAAIV